jgi:hypothetical protein
MDAMIAAVCSPGPFLNILRVQNLRGGDLEVPVTPAQSAFARFEHLRAVPSPQGGVSLFKLRVLDKLIDRLLAEGQPVPETARRPQEPGQAEGLIAELGGRLRRRLDSLAALSGNAGQARGFATQTGLLLNLVA